MAVDLWRFRYDDQSVMLCHLVCAGVSLVSESALRRGKAALCGVCHREFGDLTPLLEPIEEERAKVLADPILTDVERNWKLAWLERLRAAVTADGS